MEALFPSPPTMQRWGTVMATALPWSRLPSMRHTSGVWDSPSMDRHKQERLRTAAALYLSTHDIDAPARFDVAEVYCSENGAPNVVYLEDAFT